MATAPPPYTEHANPPVNPNYPAGGYQPYPPAGYVDPSKGVQAGYVQQPQPGYPPAQYPPPQMVQPVMAAAPQQQAQQQTIVITQPVATGNCPVCRAGNITEDFTCCGICLAIFCFPIGLICCLLMRDRRCTSCGSRV